MSLTMFNGKAFDRDHFKGLYTPTTTISTHDTLSTDLVSYYSFDGTTYTDDLHGSNDGTHTSSVKDTSDYKLGSASIKGDDTNYIGLGVCFQFTGAFSVSFWAINNYASSQPYWDGIISNYNVGGSKGWGIHTTNQMGEVFARLVDSVDTLKIIQVETSSGAVSSSTWTHVVFTYDGTASASGVKFYANGTDVSTNAQISSGFSSLGASGLSTNILNAGGVTEGGVSRPISYSVDEIGVWEKELSSDEIADLYNSGDGIPYE